VNADDTKEAMKEALKEWLDEKFAHFGKWAFASMAAAALGALIYFMLTMNGWRPPTP
jgi:hypothetical protein